MMRAVFTVCLFIIVISVAGNPVTQVVPAQPCSINQPNTYANTASIPATYQQAASQSSPYSQSVTIQNQTPSHQGLDGDIKQNLMSKLFSNSCLQKILDPNTKLYNQNGLEIQRQPNTGAGASVINNYFIMPPEFFNLNDTKTKNKTEIKRSKGNSRKKTKQKTNTVKSVDKLTAITDKGSDIDTTNKGERKRKRTKTSEKIMEPKIEIKDQEVDNKVKKRSKQGHKVKNQKITLPEPIEIKKDGLLEEKTGPAPRKNQNKKRKKSRKLKTQRDSTKDELDVVSPTYMSDNASSKIPNIISAPIVDSPVLSEKNLEGAKDTIKPEDSSDNISNSETEKRPTRNSKKDKRKKEVTQQILPIPNETLKNFFPYMNLNNYFNQNGNFPFNFEQFYQPNYGQGNTINRKPKNKKKENKQNNTEAKPLSNVVEIKLIPKNKDSNITVSIIKANNSTNETQSRLDSIKNETITQKLDSTVDVSIDVDISDIPKEVSDIPKTEPVMTKAYLKMPPTVLDDSNEFITPELGREDLVPTIHTNGIINDYYPIFHDDAFYNDESFYVKDLEDDRHFYKTDRGREELNIDKGKYDRDEDCQVPELDIDDHIDFHDDISREKEEISNLNVETKYINRPHTHEKLIAQEVLSADAKINEVTQFQTPPLLENPDFKTTKIEKDLSMPHSEYSGPVYTDFWAEMIPEKSTIFTDSEPVEFSRMVTSDAGIRTERVPAKNIRPKSDRIETVYAKTRVVKYGVAAEESEEISSPIPEHDNDDDEKFFSDGHTTFVVAKSLGHVDDYYW